VIWSGIVKGRSKIEKERKRERCVYVSVREKKIQEKSMGRDNVAAVLTM